MQESQISGHCKSVWKELNRNEKIVLSIIQLYSTDFLRYEIFTPNVLGNLGIDINADQRAANGVYSSLRTKGLIKAEEDHLPESLPSLIVTQECRNVIFYNRKEIEQYIEENEIKIGYPARG